MAVGAGKKIVKPRQISEVVLDRLRSDIIQNQFSLGEKISESKLSDAYGVTKAPIRAAFVRLELEGLIEIRPQSGTYVFKPSIAELRALCELRGALEIEASRLAMHRDQIGLAEVVSSCVAEMERALENRSLSRYQELDSELHLAIIAGAKSQMLEQTYIRQVNGRFAALRYRFSVQHAHNEASLSEHLSMRDAIVNNDLDALIAVTRNHIENTMLYYMDGQS